MESMRFKHVFEGVLILRHNVNVTRWIATISSTPSVQASKLSLDHNTAREKFTDTCFPAMHPITKAHDIDELMLYSGPHSPQYVMR